ncbi:uncharacterized protein LOC142091058 isoform X2 [Calonectris borealis]|uniref:uncharacterized protein LOC142091058 isoform X2 n=1 Tax=Calonectris borealis TaxID=1323832 RepID=UPI003F4B2546
MPSDNPAEGTQDSSFDKTHVTVYYCKDCESNICKSPNYEDFVKIGETQNETFLSKTIQLVTYETHITMCFQQENTFPEGIYAIVWEKAMGIGESCGSPDSGASSENVRGNIIKICCEAETDLSVPNPALKCYTKTSDEKTRKSTADIADEGEPGNPQFSIGEKSSIGVITPVLILAVCAIALAMCCVRQKRNDRGPVIALHQTFNAVRKTKWAPDMQKLAPI